MLAAREGGRWEMAPSRRDPPSVGRLGAEDARLGGRRYGWRGWHRLAAIGILETQKEGKPRSDDAVPTRLVISWARRKNLPTLHLRANVKWENPRITY